MSKIERLSILGVRSFDNIHKEVIHFDTPLTLIVGSNGSGKTTIIECLKYATTGDLPPNSSRGGAFIHDPKLCGEKEVMAQVKVMFRSASQRKMVITRSLVLKVNKNKAPTQRTHDGSLVVYNPSGERNAVSTRNAELDMLMPQSLGVSKAILNSVIFCHQDESLWPMSEPAALKKRFDEIFEALKYTKAIDNIKLLKKTQGQKLQQLKIAEGVAKDTKIRGDRAEKQSIQLLTEVDQVRDEIALLKTKMKEADEKQKRAQEKVSTYQQVQNDLASERMKRGHLHQNVEKIKRTLQVRSESNEWLKSEIENYEDRVKSHQKHEEQLRARYKEIEEAIKRCRARLSRKHEEIGMYEGRKAHHEQQKEGLKSLIETLSRQHNIRGYGANVDDARCEDFTLKISKLLKEQQERVQKQKQESEAELGDVQETLTKLSDQRTTLVAEKNACKQQMSQHELKLKFYRDQLSKMDTDEGELAIVDSKIEQLEDDLAKAKKESEAASWDTQIHDFDARIQDKASKIKQLNEELIHGTKHAGDLARLEHLQRELADSRRNLDRLCSVNKERFRTTLQHNWSPSDLNTDLQRSLKAKSDQLRDHERQRASLSRDLEQIDAEIASSTMALSKGKRDQASCEKLIDESIGRSPDAYTAEVQEIQEGRDVLNLDLSNFGHLRKFYQDALDLVEEKDKCKLCTRRFIGENEKEAFVKLMKRKLEKGDISKVREDLEKQDQLLRKAKSAAPAFERWSRWTKVERPQLENQLKDLAAKRTKAVQQLEAEDAKVNDAEQAKADVDMLEKPVGDVLKYHESIKRITQQIGDLTETQSSKQLSRTLDQTRDELDSVSQEAQELRTTKETISGDRERSRAKISSLELQLRDAKSEMATTDFQVKERNEKVKQVEELNASNRIQREQSRKIDDQIDQLSPQMEAAESRRDDTRSRASLKEDKLREQVSHTADSVSKLKQVSMNIRQYEAENGSANLARSRREMDEIEEEIGRTEEEKMKIIKSIKQVEDELGAQGKTKASMQDNIDYRAYLKELEVAEGNVATLESQISEADQAHWERESQKWRNRSTEYSVQQSNKIGQVSAKDTALEKHRQEWETEYKDAAINYKRAHIEVETTRAAVEDLGRYAGALDKAIMKYHSIKMAEINSIIEELWQKTYQGTDVDKILIRSDDETGKGNRSYNYRVCMVKQDTEMDMRGRCSAGQKVLASIIIRLALAECFGVNCGLIALDEPTTNLDVDNIRSLAQSLHDIIQARRHQANFQLIVITHDEDFLKFMKCPDFCDVYYRVSRNERQKSQIRVQSLSDVM